ncbi:hypothetical protein GH714_011724 [Hevea brasiliensis]|uniref:Amine oxidase domain-containing protein n=1 Tax=Hevea brasiliensis TaxID=3981 RepID=A0A6A6KDI4_HEVBR|nr:hypothetical protein GH714_011724 [Hevea brasiliensis]
MLEPHCNATIMLLTLDEKTLTRSFRVRLFSCKMNHYGLLDEISGAVCASTLARNGVSVTLFESARGPGGRMSQRRIDKAAILTHYPFAINPDLSLAPELAMKLQDIPVNPCFALMLAFAEPLSSVSYKIFLLSSFRTSEFCIDDIDTCKRFLIQNSEVLSWGHSDSSKPGRSTTSERWGSAFPAASVAEEEKCFWDGKKRLAICGDFCVSPNVEGAILSGLAAAAKFIEAPSCL